MTSAMGSASMGRMTCWTPLVVLAVFLCHLQTAAACSCAYQHPQSQFCESHFVAVMRVKKFVTVNETESAYKVKVHRIFQATPEARIAMGRKPLWIGTPSSESMCGRLNITPGKTWVIGGRMIGNNPKISLCSLAMLWSDVKPRQRKGFRQFYRHGCICQISYTPWWNKGAALESAGGKRCLWESSPGPQDCQERYGICMYGNAGCSWIPSVAYNDCIMQHQRNRVQQWAREP